LKKLSKNMKNKREQRMGMLGEMSLKKAEERKGI